MPLHLAVVRVVALVVAAGGLHVVAQVVEAELAVGAVGDVALVGAAAVGPGPCPPGCTPARDARARVDGEHPLAVAAGQVVVHGDDVDALAVRARSGTPAAWRRASCLRRSPFRRCLACRRSRGGWRRRRSGRRSAACSWCAGRPRGRRRTLRAAGRRASRPFFSRSRNLGVSPSARRRSGPHLRLRAALTWASSEPGTTVCGLSGYVEAMNPSLRTKRSLLDPKMRVMSLTVLSPKLENFSPSFSRKPISSLVSVAMRSVLFRCRTAPARKVNQKAAFSLRLPERGVNTDRPPGRTGRAGDRISLPPRPRGTDGVRCTGRPIAAGRCRSAGCGRCSRRTAPCRPRRAPTRAGRCQRATSVWSFRP